MTRYVHVKSGGPIYVIKGVTFKMGCCDCGLVHDIIWEDDEDNRLKMTITRNERATAAMRRKPHAKR